MKKILSTLVFVVLLCTVLAIPVFAAGNGTITMSSASGKQGDTVTLNVNMSQNPGLVTMTIKVTYDTNVLQLTKVTDPGVLVGSQLNSTYNSPYTISWVDGSTTVNNTKTGTIATFTFKILDNAKVGDTTVTLQFVDSFDTNYAENRFAATSGKVTVSCKSHSFGNYVKKDDTRHTRTCSVCGYIETADHTFGNWQVIKQATTQEEGLKKRTCSVCGHEETRSIEKLKTGTWQLNSVGWWYQNADGSYPANCWQLIDGAWYYFNASGYMVTGWQLLRSTWYYLSGSGAMVTGWQVIGGTWYYFDGSGAMMTGWLSDGGTWYYLNASGAMATGWVAIGGTWYYLNGSGAMMTGWQVIGGLWYYFSESGAMAANQWVGNYYLQADGSMATNKWIGGYYVGADGAWIP